MESPLKLLFLLASSPLWYRPLKAILLEIWRVARIPDAPRVSPRLVGNRNQQSGKAFTEVSTSKRKTWGRDDGRLSNPRWETGRRPAQSNSNLPEGHGFPTRRKRTGYNSNQTRFGSGGWQGGFGRR